MTKDRDELIEMLGMGISRRKMLKGMGYGLAGAAIAPSVLDEVFGATQASRRRLGASLSDYTPQPIWNYTSPPSYFFYGNPLFENGTIIVTAQDSDTYQAVLYSLDTQTKEVRWSHSFDHISFFFTPLAVGDQLYAAGNGGSLYAVDPSSGNVLWQKPYHIATDLKLANGNIIFPTTDGRIVAVDLGGNQVWSYSTGESVGIGGFTPVIASGGIATVAMNNTLYAVDLQSGAYLWKYAAGDLILGSLSVGGGNVYFSSRDGFLYAIEVSMGGLKWKWPPSASTNSLSSPVYYIGAIYVGDGAGRFYALQAETGTPLWPFISVEGSISIYPIYIEDGIAYFSATEAGKSKLYAVDLPSKGQEIVSYDPSALARVVGIETGICYFETRGRNLGAVNLAGLIHQVFCESELMVEDYQTSTSTQGYQGNSTSFRTHVQLFDPNKNPRANKSIKVWASEAVTITSGGQSYDIDAASTGKSAWLQTDSIGELSIVSTAVGITSPALYLWGNFMELDEAIVIYPDHDTLNRLSNVQGGDLSQATTYDGSPMLPSGYVHADDLASTVRNTIGGTAQAMLLTRERHRRNIAKKRRAKRRRSLRVSANTYIAYPESMPNILYQPVAGPAERTYVSTGVNWNSCFDPNTGAVTFNCGAVDLPADPQFSFSFHDFVSKVVNGAQKVVQLAWDAAKDAVQTIKDDAGNIYQFAVNTVEHAVAVVAGALKTVIGDIKKAVQWLSYLFNWDDMLATKETLKTAVNKNVGALKNWVDAQLNGDITAIHTFFTNLEEQVRAGLSNANGAIGGKTLQSQQVNNNNPQTIFGAGGAKSYTKGQWLMSKFKDNASQATVGSPSSPGNDADAFLTNIKQFGTDVVNIITNDPNQRFQKIPGDLKDLISDFGLLVTDPSEFVTKGFGDLLNLISDIVVSLLQLVDAVIESLLKQLNGFIDAVLDLVNQPINIPVISDLYSLISHGSQLTILDLFCLIVAVPTTIISKAINSAAQEVGQRTGAVGDAPLVLIGALVAGPFFAVLDAFADLSSNLGIGLKSLYLASSVVITGLGDLDDLVNSTSPDGLFDALQVIPVMMTGVDMALSRVGTDSIFEGFKVIWEGATPTINMVYGVGMWGFTLSKYAYNGVQPLPLIQNIFGFLPFGFKFLAEGPDFSPNRIALGVVDAVGDLTSVIIGAEQNFPRGAPS